MNAFRDTTNHKYGTEYYRDVQPIGSRTVTLYDVNYDPLTYGGDAAGASIAALWSPLLLLLLPAFF